MVKITILVIIIAFSLGWTGGRKRGYITGRKDERAEYILELKEEALDEGLCPVCLAKMDTFSRENFKFVEVVKENKRD